MLLHQQSQIQLKNCPADLIHFNYQAPLMDIKTVGYKCYHPGSVKKKPHSPVYNKKSIIFIIIREIDLRKLWIIS